MPIGSRLRQLREKQNLSQNQLAKLAGISQSGLSSIESNESRPREDSIKAVAAALGVTIAELMGEATPSNAQDTFTETMLRRPQMRILFDAAKDAPDDVLQKTADLLEVLKNERKE